MTALPTEAAGVAHPSSARAAGALAVLALLLGPGLASATIVIPNGTTGLNYVTGGVQLIDGPGAGSFVGRTFADPSVAQRTIGLSEKVGLQLQGRSLVATVGRTLAMGEVALAAAALGGSAYVGYQIGTGIAKTLGLGGSSNGTRVVPTLDGWQFDEGQATTGVNSYTIPKSAAVSGATGVYSSSTPNGVCSDYAAAYAAERTRVNNGSPSYSVTSTSATNTNCSAVYRTSTGATVNSSATITLQVVQQCPAVIDPLNSALSRPAGDAPGPDGKCAAGRYSTIAPPIAGQKIGTYGDASTLKDLAEGVLAKGGTITTQSPRTVTDVTPPSVTEAPTTTTSTAADGSTTTTTKTPTTTYQKTGDTITYNQTFNTITQSCTAAGSCSTSSTSTTTPSTATKEGEQKTDCDKVPDSVGCTKLGEAPTDAVPKKTSSVSFTPETIGPAGSCPAPVPLPNGQSISYQTLCDGLVTVRPLIIAIGFVVAGLIVVNALKAG